MTIFCFGATDYGPSALGNRTGDYTALRAWVEGPAGTQNIIEF